jgi:hypothetical protein
MNIVGSQSNTLSPQPQGVATPKYLDLAEMVLEKRWRIEDV